MKTSMARRGGFTLIELLVVISIILILIVLLMPILGVIGRKKMLSQAQKQVKDIANAAAAYYDDLKQYPPDTGAYTTGTINEGVAAVPDSIFLYLSIPVTEKKSGRVTGPYLTLRPDQLRKIGGKMIYIDPWGNPYHMDCVHTVQTDVVNDPGKIERRGEPYAAGTPDNKKILDVKVWSNGPDRQELDGSKEDIAPYANAVNADNVMSWNIQQ